MMEDSQTKLGIMEFAPRQDEEVSRPFWTYATNGMSERRMPCENQPHGDPRFRTELIAYSLNSADWIVDLLHEIALYPFNHRSGLAIGHTMPVQQDQSSQWSGYLLCDPLFEPEDFNPLPIDIGIEPDWVFFVQIAGLLDSELKMGISDGGSAIAEKLKARHAQSRAGQSPAFLDISRKAVL